MNKETNTIISNLEGCSGMFDYCLTPKASNLLVSDIKELQQENKQLKDNWNKLKEIMEEETREYWNTNILEIMQELEKGSDKDV